MANKLAPIVTSKPVMLTTGLSIVSLIYKAIDAAGNMEFLLQKIGINEEAAKFLGSSRGIDFLVAVSLLALVISLIYQVNRASLLHSDRNELIENVSDSEQPRLKEPQWQETAAYDLTPHREAQPVTAPQLKTEDTEARESKLPKEKPKPYLKCVAARPTTASVSGIGGWVKSGKRNIEAITAIFTNVSKATLRYVTARITYYTADGSFYHQVNKGEWLDGQPRYVDLFSIHENRELMLSWRLSEKDVFASGDKDRKNLNPAGNQIRVKVNFVAGIPEKSLQSFEFKLTLEPFSIEQIISAPQDDATNVSPQRLITKDMTPQLPEPNVEELKGRIKELDADIKVVRREREQFRIEAARQQKEATTQSIRADSNHSRLEEYKWLHEIAEGERRQIEKHVVVETCAMNPLYLWEDLPYVVFDFTVYNGSVYSISVQDLVDGFIRFKGQHLDAKARMLDNQVKNCPRGGRNTFRIRQRVLKDEAALISDTLKSSGNLFDFSELIVTVSGGDAFPNLEPARLDLTRGMQNADLDNKIIELENANAELRREITSWQESANYIDELNVALGACYHAYNQSERGGALSQDLFETLKMRISRALALRPNEPKDMGQFYDELPEILPDSINKQKEWIDSQCSRLRALIREQHQNVSVADQNNAQPHTTTPTPQPIASQAGDLKNYLDLGKSLLQEAVDADKHGLTERLTKWEHEVGDYLEAHMGRDEKARFLSDADMEVYVPTKAYTRAPNQVRPKEAFLNRIHTRVARLERLIEKLN